MYLGLDAAPAAAAASAQEEEAALAALSPEERKRFKQRRRKARAQLLCSPSCCFCSYGLVRVANSVSTALCATSAIASSSAGARRVPSSYIHAMDVLSTGSGALPVKAC